MHDGASKLILLLLLGARGKKGQILQVYHDCRDARMPMQELQVVLATVSLKQETD